MRASAMYVPDVEKIFEKPESAESGAGGFAFEKEKDEAGERRDEFGERAAENHQRVAEAGFVRTGENAKNRMTSFVNGEICEIDEEKVRRVDGGIDEKENVDNDPGDAAHFRDGFPVAEAFRE